MTEDEWLTAIDPTSMLEYLHGTTPIRRANFASDKLSLLNRLSLIASDLPSSEEMAFQVAILRCLFGNPFRPVTVEPDWLTSDVVALAEGIYNNRAFDRLPTLADALQDAGCDNADMLDHCRGPGSHVRGCWVVDLVLGKE